MEEEAKYEITEEQEETLAEVQELGRKGSGMMGSQQKKEWVEDLDWSLARFWYTMLDQELLESEFDSGLLSSFFPDRPYKAPFILTGRPSSERKYLGLLKRCVCFCVRFWRLNKHTAEGFLRRSLNRRQRQALKQLWCHEGWRASDSGDAPDRHVRASSDMTLADDVVSPRQISSRSRRRRLGSQGSTNSIDTDDNDSDRSENSSDDADLLDDYSTDPDDETEPNRELCEADRAPERTTTPADALSMPRGLDETLPDLVLGFVHFLATEEYEEGKPSSTLLVYFSSVLGISKPYSTKKLPYFLR